jgi:hypothetical protein
MSNFVLPYEPEYTAHREAEKRRHEIKDWLRQGKAEVSSPSVVPERDEASFPTDHLEHQ